MKRTVKTQTDAITDVLRCAKPLIFENNEAEFRYSIQGTCFLARFNSHFYAITAKHCLRNFSCESVRIRLNPGELQFLPIKAWTLPRCDNEDFWDLAFFEIEHKHLSPAVLGSKDFLDLDHHSKHGVDKEEILAIVGHPTELNAVDYDNFIVNTQGFSVDGRYIGPAEDKNCSKIRFNDLSRVKNLDGLSGSPVLAFREVREKTYTYNFVGVLIRATQISGMGRYINSSIVVQALKHLSAAS